MRISELVTPHVSRRLDRAPRRRVWMGDAWRVLALLPVLLLAVALTWRDAVTPPAQVTVAPAVDDPAPEVSALPTLTEAPPAAAPEATTPSAGSGGGAPATGSGSRPVAPPPVPQMQVVRVRIPALSVDAPVQQMGLDTAGAMEVPYSPGAVAWYGFTALPGTPGNAVMSGHVDWLGARAVFYAIRTLQAGDTIEVTTSEGRVTYTVQRTYLVPWCGPTRRTSARSWGVAAGRRR